MAAGSVGPGNYRINLNAKLTGLAALVSNVKLALAATGSLRKSGPAPSTYATTSANSIGSRTVRMSLDSGNVKAVEISRLSRIRKDEYQSLRRTSATLLIRQVP